MGNITTNFIYHVWLGHLKGVWRRDLETDIMMLFRQHKYISYQSIQKYDSSSNNIMDILTLIFGWHLIVSAYKDNPACLM